MKSEDIKVGTAGQIATSAGLRLMDDLCLFVPLLVFLAVLAWATWEIRSVNPMAFAMFAALIAAVVVLAIAGLWPRRIRSVSVTSSRLHPNRFASPLSSTTRFGCRDQLKKSTS